MIGAAWEVLADARMTGGAERARERKVEGSTWSFRSGGLTTRETRATDLGEKPASFGVANEVRPVLIAAKLLRVAEDEERRSGAGESDVHTAEQPERVNGRRERWNKGTHRVSAKNPTEPSADPPRTQERMIMSFSCP